MNKIDVLKTEKQVIYTVFGYSNYRACDSYEVLLREIHDNKTPRFFEYIRNNVDLALFFDLDVDKTLCEDNKETIETEGNSLYNRIIFRLKDTFTGFQLIFYRLKYHKYDNEKMVKYSIHLIVRIFKNHIEYGFKSILL